MAREHKKPEPTRRDVLRWLAAGALTTLGTTSYANCAASQLTVERHVLHLPRWDADGFRVAVLADLHVDSQLEVDHAIAACRLALAEKPDLIAIPGDFIILGRRPNPEFVLKALEPLHDAKCPVVATLGNHDYDHWKGCHIIDALQQSPAKLLRNDTSEVRGVTVAGVDDGIAGYFDTRFLREGKFSKSLLTLFHEPDYVVHVPETVSLQLSGHSHGGQICLPGGIPIYCTRGAQQYSKGFYPHAKAPLYVSRGVGTTGPRWRLFCPPEVSILTLFQGFGE